jgi:pimeloyl-ACP methyl ester carboxylesterase
LQRNGYEFSFNLYDKNKKFNKPSLILLGKQDSCVGYKDFLKIFDNFPRTTLAILDKAGHNLQLEQETLFNSLITEWLQRINCKGLIDF